jgi:hypothetical protein
MSLNDENSNAEGGNGFLSSTPSPLGEETKKDDTAPSSFSFTGPNGNKIEVQTLGDILAAAPEERRWTVEGILPDSGLAVLGGHAKAGKSTLALHLGRSVESGEPFLDRDTDKRAVVYVNYEMPLDYFASLSEFDPVPENFYVINRPEPRLTMPTVRAILGALKDRGVERGIMLIDSFRGAFKLTGEQENQSGAAGLNLRVLQEIGVKTGWLIVVIHHHKKGGDAQGADKLSGTSDFSAASDVIWTWSRLDPLKPGVLEIEGRIPPVDPLQVQLSPDECSYLGTKQGGSEEDEKQRILDALAEKRLTGKEIVAMTGIPYSTVMKRLKSLKDEGRAISQTGTGTGSPHLWFRSTTESPVSKSLAATTKMED